MTVYALRIFLSLAAGLAANIITGSLDIKLLKENNEIRSTGAIAFALLTFYSAPTLTPTLDPINVQRDPPRIINGQVWTMNNLLPPHDYPEAQRSRWVFDTVTLMQRKAALEPIQGEGKTIYAIAETPRMDAAYRAFEAEVRTLPPLSKSRPGDRHKIQAFLVSTEKRLHSYTPLTRKFDEMTRELFINVPESRPGDYLMFIIEFRFSEKTPTQIIPFELRTN